MILMLSENGTEPIAGRICEQLRSDYETQYPPAILPANAAWSREPEWDDVLVVIYNTPELSPAERTYIEAFRDAHALTLPGSGQREPGGFVVPVAADPAHPKPPIPISGLKAAAFHDEPETLGRISRAVGVFLGLALRPANQRIFVSYRSTDGGPIAREIHGRLEQEGFPAWLDEAHENLPIGTNVQARIHEHVDTPDAPESDWVAEEIERANAQLIPVVPVVIGTDRSRFIALRMLGREAPVKPMGPDGQPVTEDEWNKVRSEIQQVLLEAYRRRLLLRARAERAFLDCGFGWSVLDDQLRMYRAELKNFPLPATVVLSHCCVHDIKYVPALRAYADYVRVNAAGSSANYKICVYDRERVLSGAEFREIDSMLNDRQFILAHHNQLHDLVVSNFTRLK